jgi:sialic acid synthase SpsE
VIFVENKLDNRNDRNKIMNKIIIDGREIGGNQTFIIAEIGSNHNQSIELAFESIDAAVECGADAVKFQSIDVDELYYQPSVETKALHRKIDMAQEWHRLLSEYCAKKGITFFSAPTYLKAVDLLEEINVSLYKLASAQIGTFPQIIERVAATGKPVILSTGIVTIDELKNVVDIFKRHNNDKFIILHCNSIYPTPYDKVHLNIMNKYRDEFDCIVGFSDHSPDIYVPIVATAIGAKVIEKHFALDRTLPVPDAPFSLEPHEFKRMVEGIRAAEQSLIADTRQELHPEESQFKESILYRLVANKPLVSGELLKSDDFKFLRHPEGVDCRDLQKYLDGKSTYKKNIQQNSLIHFDDINFEGVLA